MSFIKKKKIEEVTAAKNAEVTDVEKTVASEKAAVSNAAEVVASEGTVVGDTVEVATPRETAVTDTDEEAVGVEDVVGFYTKLFRNPTAEGFKETDAMKAAEFFTKYYNMLDKGADSEGMVIIVDDIGGGRHGK